MSGAAVIGKHTWAFAGGHIPLASTGKEPEFTSNDKIAVLNVGAQNAEIGITIYHPSKAPVKSYRLSIRKQRVRKFRFNDLVDPLPISLDTPYSFVLTSKTPVVVQFSRTTTESRYHSGFCTTPLGFRQHSETKNQAMTKEIGHRIWAVAEGYIPSYGNGPEPQMTSHETACILNTNDAPAHITITIYYADRDPVGPYHVTVDGNRTKHVRLNDLEDPAPIPRDTDYAFVIESDVPIVVQHTRLDSRQAENALMTTMAFAVT